jgi:hypothetical protein
LDEILEEDPRKSTREVAVELSLSQTTVCNRLKVLGKVLKEENGFRSVVKKVRSY